MSFLTTYGVPELIVDQFLFDVISLEVGWNWDDDSNTMFCVCNAEDLGDIHKALDAKNLSFMKFIDGPIVVQDASGIVRPTVHVTIDSILKALGRDVTGYKTGVL